MPHDIPPGERRIVLVLASVAAFLAPFMGASLNVAVPAIGREFRMSAVTLGWIAMTYLLAAAVCLVPFG
ncbi:MAG TPA: MFS transporter, partial [Candidatus Aminicenantes bacterium]|nr:MFS transporter [Candidatus Aminicenantes bacterium]